MAESSFVRHLAGIPRLFDALRWTLEGGYAGHHRLIRDHLTNVGRIIDLGCGTGIYARFFTPETYVGIDINPEYIAAARVKFPQHPFHVQDALSSPFSAGEFDAGMISGVLHHLNDDDADRALREIARLVRPGGRVVIWEDIPARRRWNLIGHLIHRLDLGAHIRTPAEYQALISRHLDIAEAWPMRSGAMDYQVFVGRPRAR